MLFPLYYIYSYLAYQGLQFIRFQRAQKSNFLSTPQTLSRFDFGTEWGFAKCGEQNAVVSRSQDLLLSELCPVLSNTQPWISVWTSSCLWFCWWRRQRFLFPRKQYTQSIVSVNCGSQSTQMWTSTQTIHIGVAGPWTDEFDWLIDC
jgi:hypothetical protein